VEDYSANASLSWEADIWGKIRRQKESTIAQYLQTYEAAKAVQTQLVAGIAQGFYNLLMLDAQMSIARRNLALSDSTLKVTRLQRDAGDVTTLAVEQAESQRLSTAVLIPQIEQAIAIQENALSVLTGENPSVIVRPGDSGGPMVSDAGVIGMDVAADTENGFAIPINTVLAVARKLASSDGLTGRGPEVADPLAVRGTWGRGLSSGPHGGL